jgi:chromosomal replication initiator protein
MWWRSRNTKDSLAAIGLMYGDRDHATVIHARKTVNNLMETNKVFREKAEEALKLLEPLKF